MGTSCGKDENTNPVNPLLDGLGSSLFDALSPHIAILDDHGKVLGVNKSWRSFRKLHPPPPHSLEVGDNYLETCRLIPPEHQNESDAFLKGFLAVKKGLLLEFSYEFSAMVSGGCRWFQCKMTPLEMAGCRNILLSHEDITELKQAQNEIHKLAYFDNLTGLPNRLLFFDRLNQALSKADRDRKMVGVLFLDLDRFKAINDTLGHAAGDQLLQTVAQRVKNSLRAMDTVARFAGDEFVILLPDLEHPDDASLIAKKLLKSLSVKLRLGDNDIFPSCSVGIALYPDDARSTETLIGYADLAMYHAKESGRHNFQFFSQELNSRVKARMGMETDLRRALQQQEFDLFYQPVYDLKSGRWVAVKPLLRWNHPQKGLLPAHKFISLSEETGLILGLGRWALLKGCRQVKEWQELGWPDLQLSINLSLRQMQAPGTLEMVSNILRETGFDPVNLVLEIEETVFLKSLEENFQILLAFKHLGIQIAVNNFGFSFSSLRYIKRLGVNRLNIDHSFIRNAPGNPEDEAITEAIIKMGKSLHVKVLGKGVEKPEQMEFLRQHQCDEIQGFYFDSPAPPAELLKRIKIRSSSCGNLPPDAPTEPQSQE
ncbi:MAG: EAL domain-containing protein [Desulfuromonadaceae bacterium]|nr:EAL domain-containing protein [Desulfuromonadaceae bacterium]